MSKIIQLQFLQMVKDSLPANCSLHKELSELLNLSTDSIYRRLRGETALGLDEAIKICKTYQIPLDSFIQPDEHFIPFRFKKLGNEEQSLYEFLSGIVKDLKQIASAEQKEIVFAAEDIPIFHYFNFPELAAFKMFYWNRSILNVPSLEGKKFSPSLIAKEMIDLGKQILDLYTIIPSIEIWTEDTANSMFKQIEFYWES